MSSQKVVAEWLNSLVKTVVFGKGISQQRRGREVLPE